MDTVDDLLQLVEQDDYCSVLLLIGILVYVGQHVVAECRPARVLGRRLAFIVFVAYVLFRSWNWPLPEANDLVAVVLRGLLAAGLALGVAWVALPFLLMIHQGTTAVLLRWLSRRWHALRRLQERWQEWSRAKRARSHLIDDSERERRQLEAEAQLLRKREAQRRRETARAYCELVYSLLAPEIGDRFSRETFDAFLDKYLNDRQDPEYVEHWAQHLQAMLRQHLEKVQPPGRFHSLEAIAVWFQEEKKKIDGLAIDDRTKRILVANLRTKYDELTTRYLEELA